MAGSADKYYADKMKRLLEKQSIREKELSQPSIAAPAKEKNGGRADDRSDAAKTGASAPRVADGRAYYERFRSSESGRGSSSNVKSVGKGAQKTGRDEGLADRREKYAGLHSGHANQGYGNGMGQAVRAAAVGQAVSESGDGRQRSFQADRQPKTNGTFRGADGGYGRQAPRSERTSGKKRSDIGISPEQTLRDKRLEEIKRAEAMRRAARSRRLRKLRDAAVTVVLVLCVLAAIITVIYRLLFVIKNISVEGGVSYSDSDILSAAGVSEGDHLYSFSSRIAGREISLYCPLVSSVKVKRSAPSTVVFTVQEETPEYYADFYGEWRALSGSLRVLDPVYPDEAAADGLVKLILPDASKAIAGETVEFASLRNSDYINQALEAVKSSSLADRIKTVNLSSQYSITMSCDGKYRLLFGSNESIDTKLRIAARVLEDEMFNDGTKAQIDVSKLTESSVIKNDKLVIE